MTAVYIKRCENDRAKQHDSAWALLADSLKKDFGKDISALTVSYGQRGKPYFADSNVYFSISHAEEYVACAISDDCRVGLDIEKVHSVSERVRNKLLSGCEDGEKAIEEWTKRESWGKLTGEGALFKGNIPEAANFIVVDVEGGYKLTLCKTIC